MPIPSDYVERVYAGVLGKIIGVYLGRPVEGWTYERIMAELGEINYYVHERLNRLLILTDDDIAGTFTFLRALPDYDNRCDLTPAQIGQTWLNYIIEGRAILWWGGLGRSTENTAYLRLKSGISAPRSGSVALNGKVIAEQIGAQIFIEGWGMVAPGDPEFAVDLARRAASVSHDCEGIYGAQVVAAMVAQAFVESDLHALIDTAVGLIPPDSVIYRLIADVREWHAQDGDWRKTRERIVARYGYDKFGGSCHIVPNHALIMLSLLYGEDDFQRSLMIVNTSGWDTDCNAGNVGCLLGIKNGLAGIEDGPDWRGPVADKLYLPTADGGRAITDAVTETFHVVNIGRALAGLEPLVPKGGARFHFELPGSVQGFCAEDSAEARDTTILENVALARANSTPVCQDTGTPIFYVHHPQGTSTRELRAQIEAGVAAATSRAYLRPNAVDSLTGRNSGNNLGTGYPTFHFEEWEKEYLQVDLLLKGGGSENVGAQYKLPHAPLKAGRDLEGVRRVVLDAVNQAQGLGCAPGVLGIAVGGDRGASYIKSKQQLFRPLEDTNDEPELAELEDRLLRFEKHYQEIAQPFEWKFTRRDLAKLLSKLELRTLRSMSA